MAEKRYRTKDAQERIKTAMRGALDPHKITLEYLMVLRAELKDFLRAVDEDINLWPDTAIFEGNKND